MSDYKGPATSFLHSFTNGETGLKPLEWNSKPVCATEGCNSASSGKSKYCREHAREARAAWLDKVRAASEEREQRKASHADLWRRVQVAAETAHTAAIPTPMTVVESEGLTGTPTGRSWYVSEGACGFGGVVIRPGNSSFALWLKSNGYANKTYGGGVRFSTNFNSQSYERASAAASAACIVLRAAGIKAYPDSRLD